MNPIELFQYIVTFSTNRDLYPSSVIHLFENHVLDFLIFTESKKNGLAQTLVARQFTEPDLTSRRGIERRELCDDPKKPV
jgi:hypothetical protein